MNKTWWCEIVCVYWLAILQFSAHTIFTLYDHSPDWTKHTYTCRETHRSIDRRSGRFTMFVCMDVGKVYDRVILCTITTLSVYVCSLVLLLSFSFFFSPPWFFTASSSLSSSSSSYYFSSWVSLLFICIFFPHCPVHVIVTVFILPSQLREESETFAVLSTFFLAKLYFDCSWFELSSLSVQIILPFCVVQLATSSK